MATIDGNGNDSVRRDTLETTATSIVMLMAIAFGAIALARGLGPVGRGQLASLMAWAALSLTIGTFGTTDAVTFFVARDARSAANAVRQVWRAAPLMVAGATTVFALLTMLGTDQGVSWIVIAVIGLYLAVLIFTEEALAVLRGNAEFRRYNAVRLVAGTAPPLVFVTLMFLDGLSVARSAFVYLFSIAVAAGLAYVGLRRTTPTGRLMTASGQPALPWPKGRPAGATRSTTSQLSWGRSAIRRSISWS